MTGKFQKQLSIASADAIQKNLSIYYVPARPLSINHSMISFVKNMSYGKMAGGRKRPFLPQKSLNVFNVLLHKSSKHSHAYMHKLTTSSLYNCRAQSLLAFCDPELTAARAPEKDNTLEAKVCRDKLNRRGK